MYFSSFEEFQLYSIGFSPIHEKALNTFSFNFIFTNTAYFLTVVLFYFIFWIFLISKSNVQFISTQQLIYSFFYTTIYSYIEKYTKDFFPMIMFFFFFICISNLIGILPYTFTVTSHLSITFCLSYVMFIALQYVGLSKFGVRFFTFFFPKGIPFRLTFFLVLIEVISYVFRLLSLALRLFANIVAGHILLHTIVTFTNDTFTRPSFLDSTLFHYNVILYVFPVAVSVLLLGLESGVAILQAYVFIILSSIYLRDCLEADNH